MNTIHNNIKLLQKYVLFQLDEDQEFEIQEHLAGCDECSALVHQLRLVAQENRRLHEEWVIKKKEDVTVAKPVALEEPGEKKGAIRWLMTDFMSKAAIGLIMLASGGGAGFQIAHKMVASRTERLEIENDSIKHEYSTLQDAYAEALIKKTDTIVKETLKPITPAEQMAQNQTAFKLDPIAENMLKPQTASVSGKSKISPNYVKIQHKITFWKGDTITFTNDSDKNISLSILNKSGNEIEKVEKIKPQKPWSTTNLDEGVYIYQFLDDKLNVITTSTFYVVKKPE